MDLVERARQTAEIQRLNDEFRTSMVGGMLLLTPGVEAFFGVVDVLERVRTFADFNEENDPFGEHDFGAFILRGRHFFFKIDYMDHTLQQGSIDPADPDKTTRVLTVMLASEY